MPIWTIIILMWCLHTKWAEHVAKRPSLSAQIVKYFQREVLAKLNINKIPSCRTPIYPTHLHFASPVKYFPYEKKNLSFGRKTQTIYEIRSNIIYFGINKNNSTLSAPFMDHGYPPPLPMHASAWLVAIFCGSDKNLCQRNLPYFRFLWLCDEITLLVATHWIF